MRKSKYSKTQIVGILKQEEGGRKVREVCREHGISEAAYHQWKSKYGGLEAEDIRRLKEIETRTGVSNSSTPMSRWKAGP